MYAGHIVERAPTRTLFKHMRSPYTEALMAAIPKLNAPPHVRLTAIQGVPPDPTRLAPGCPFNPRCRLAQERCRGEAQPLRGGMGTATPAGSRCRCRHDGSQRQPHLRPEPTLLKVENLVVEYSAGAHRVHTVSDAASISVAVRRRDSSASLVAASRRSPLAVLQLFRPTGGKVVFDGIDLTGTGGERLRRLRRRVQLIFRDPISSPKPAAPVGDIVAEPLIIGGIKDDTQRERRVREVLLAVGLDPDLVMGRRPHELSGGQCLRISIARTLVLEPDLVICDEPVSALDVSIRAQILNLLEDMKTRYGLTLIFIAHDLAVVNAVSDRVAVMYLGKLCKIGPAEQVFQHPAHPYTSMLLQAIPLPDPNAVVPKGVVRGEPHRLILGEPSSPSRSRAC
jgi:peptide/nickel transport system ATP-binding protein